MWNANEESDAQGESRSYAKNANHQNHAEHSFLSIFEIERKNGNLRNKGSYENKEKKKSRNNFEHKFLIILNN